MLTYKTLPVNGRTYAYTRTGSGEALLLLHGFTGTSETWTPFISDWQDTYEVITLDLPGHGKTDKTNAKSMEELTQDMALILTTLQIEKAHILGYSMGGRTALAFALDHPSFVKSLLLESASPGIAAEKERLARQKADLLLADRIEAKGIVSFVNAWEDIPLFHTQKNLPLHVQENIREERLAQKEVGLAMSLRMMGTGFQASYWSRLAEITCPTLLIVGAYDEKFVQLNEKMVKLIETAELHSVCDAGHAVHIEASNNFKAVVHQFIKKIDKIEGE